MFLRVANLFVVHDIGYFTPKNLVKLKFWNSRYICWTKICPKLGFGLALNSTLIYKPKSSRSVAEASAARALGLRRALEHRQLDRAHDSSSSVEHTTPAAQ